MGRLPGLGGLADPTWGLLKRIEGLERKPEEDSELRTIAAEKLAQGANLTRREVAAHLGVSTKKIQRMDAARELVRCSGLDGVVRYAARDVLRLASAR